MNITDPKPSKEAMEAMERALQARNTEGLIDPFISFSEPPPSDQLYPRFTQNIAFVDAFDFEGGNTPDYLEYVPGHERPGGPRFDGTNFEAIVYENPVYNLPLKDQQLLLQAQSAASNPQPANNSPLSTGTPIPSATVPATPTVINTESGLKLCSAGNTTPLTNFSINVKERRHMVMRNDLVSDEIEMSVVCCGIHHTVILDAKKVDTVVKAIQSQIPECTIAPDVKNVNKLVSNFVRMQLACRAPKNVFKFSGFACIDSQWIYVHDGERSPNPNVIFETKKRIPCLSTVSPLAAFQHALSVLNLSSKEELILPLFLLIHLGPLFALFKQAGYPPRFVTFLSGTTGSLKTSVALALFRLFQENIDTPEANFLDSVAALEKKLGKADGKVVLVDDFCPAVTTSSGKEKLAKLESIIRFIGDQISKARCKPNMESAEEYIPTGCCIVTGECTGGSRSSLLRCLVLPIERGDIDGNLLQLFQTQPQLLQTHLFHFLRWCGKNGSRIIQFVQREFLMERQRFISAVAERRLADTGAILMLVARIILQYALENRFLNEDHTTDLQSRWEASLKVALSTSETCTHELDPLVMYLTAVFSMYRTGKLPLADSADTYSAERHTGFQNGSCWWLRPDDTFQAVKRYWKSAGQIFPLRDSDIRKQLYAHNLIEVTAEQRNGREKILYTKKSSTLPGRPRFLVLRANDAADYLEHEQEYYSN